MRDSTPVSTTSKSQESNPRDGLLRIHHRRAGAYQPKDSLGLSCILQVGDAEGDHQSLMRRRSLTVPPDNIGISCLPTGDGSENSKAPESEASPDAPDIPDSQCLKKVELDVLKKLQNLRTSDLADDRLLDIGISNIRRPKKALKPRKPILPKTNIGSSCQLLQRPTVSNTSIRSMEKVMIL
ncbi:uncharacterized protein LOC106636502 [Copidosoma floridanum]|uniref:uncharacterized protein LOC106636502 n=1 Tax=Copidosoma floridanum TaxID=29053 RepID=UPI0006C98723|nr:uncharacterized protein LOC106636502 [Copidosoma floridanum]